MSDEPASRVSSSHPGGYRGTPRWVQVFGIVILILVLVVVARQADAATLGALGGDLLHPAVGLLVLLVITVLNVYKPRGLTPYGWRQQRDPRSPG